MRVAAAIRYALTRMARMRPYLDHGIPELDDNTAERAMRAVAIGRKNYLFVGSQTGGRAAAIACTLIETANSTASIPKPGWRTRSLASRTGRSTASMNSCRGAPPSRAGGPNACEGCAVANRVNHNKLKYIFVIGSDSKRPQRDAGQ